MRISDWSSDVCSSDLLVGHLRQLHRDLLIGAHEMHRVRREGNRRPFRLRVRFFAVHRIASLSAVLAKIGRASGKERVCQYRVDLGGRGIIKKENTQRKAYN